MATEDQESPNLNALLSTLPPICPGDLRADIKALVSARSPPTGDTKSEIPLLVVLDDDPTGTQTCHDISVLTVWDNATLTSTFQSAITAAVGGFFILTNSRALHPPEASALINEICQNLKSTAAALGITFEIVLRSDSTLRGHFPLEPLAAEAVLGPADLWILAPFFLQGGRYTINDVHYVAEGETLVPAGQTAFARDATFGYANSNLAAWVEEKFQKAGETMGQRKVRSLGVQDVREQGPAWVAETLGGWANGDIVVVNAASEQDMDVVMLGILEAAKKGKKFLFRSGAALVSSRLGIKPIPPLSSDALHLNQEVGGLIIAGSYVPKTTAQLATLRSKSGDALTTVELPVGELLKSTEQASNVILAAVETAEKEISRGQDILVMTSRELITGKDERESLDIGGTVAKALVEFLEKLGTKPRYIIAKGGITSSDMATKGLRMQCATVVGQAAPGVPLWRCDEETSKWSGIPYIVFPGNVGSEETLFEVVDGWRKKT